MDIDSRLDKLVATIEADRERLAETARILTEQSAETDRRFKETDRLFQESRLAFDRQMHESRLAWNERFAETDRLSKRLSRQLGGMSHRNGAMAETYFYNTFKKTKMFGDEKYDSVKRKAVVKNNLPSFSFV